ncbi:MAG TPA: TIGR01777 family oxidoreductase [Candidatus Eisenbacteria bacterium]|nr:TIGR01777 family oxidoreductase [Candidatus Eisenbacteria bacterium]
MRVLIGGASGMIGGAVVRLLTGRGHETHRLVRAGGAASGGGERAANAGGAGATAAAGVPWDPDRGILDPAALRGFDAVVHFGGVSIASGRWTVERKQAILESRVRSTLLLAERIAATPAAERPRAFVVASASGYYGNRGEEPLPETAAPGEGFLADVCRAWEEAASPAARAGTRVAHARIGMVIAREGGALDAMLLPFRLGLGGPLGNGRQWWPWISLDDVAGVFARLVEDEAIDGAVNAVAPEPVTCAAFARALGKALHRPAIFPAPAFALRLLLGEMADALLLASTKAVPERLARAGFTFRHPRLDDALRAALAG